MIAMPVACVVDASVGIKIVLTEVLSSEARTLFAHLTRDPWARFYAPDLFDVECANSLLKQVQRSGLPLAQAQNHLATLTALAVQRMPIPRLVTQALTLAATYGISAYDACYVALSQQIGLPLITADTKLVTKLAGSPYTVLDLATLTIPPPPP